MVHSNDAEATMTEWVQSQDEKSLVREEYTITKRANGYLIYHKKSLMCALSDDSISLAKAFVEQDIRCRKKASA